MSRRRDRKHPLGLKICRGVEVERHDSRKLPTCRLVLECNSLALRYLISDTSEWGYYSTPTNRITQLLPLEQSRDTVLYVVTQHD